jgi:hypothetical protein
MAVIQDMMAGKRTRTQAEEGTKGVIGERVQKAPRTRLAVAESIEGGNDGQEDEEMLDSVVAMAPPVARGSGGNRRTARHVLEERNNRESRRMNVAERNTGVERNVAVEEAEAPPQVRLLC